MLSSRGADGGDAGGFNGGRSAAAVGAPARAEGGGDDLEDEIPF